MRLHTLLKNGRKYFFALLVVFILISFFHLHLYRYLTIETLARYQYALKHWTNTHYLSAVITYLVLFTSLIACGIPCATFFTLLGGYLFGTIAVFYAEFATAFGGLILFLIVRMAFAKSIAKASTKWIKKLEHGFQENAFNYLLTLRLVPIFPCWISNISAGVLNVPIKTFLTATLIGIFPSTLIYALAGRSLDQLINSHDKPVMNLIFTPSILLPLLALALLSLLPIFYKSIKKKNKKD